MWNRAPSWPGRSSAGSDYLTNSRPVPSDPALGRPDTSDPYSSGQFLPALAPVPTAPDQDQIRTDSYVAPYTGPLDLDDYGRETDEMRRAYDDLHRKEPAVRAAIDGKAASVAALDLIVKPRDKTKPNDVAAAAFVKEQLEQSEHGADGLILNMLRAAFVRGWSVLEKTFRTVPGPSGPRWGLLHCKSRDTAHLRLRLDGYRNVLGVVNTVRGIRTHDPRKVILFTHADLYSNPYGQSDLRAAYRSANLINDAYQLWHVAVKVFGGPFLKGKVKDGTRRKQMETALRAARAAGTIVTPEEDDVEILNMASATSFDAFEKKVRIHREEIYLAVRHAYMPFMQSSSGGSDQRGDTGVSKHAGSDPLEFLTAKAVGRVLSHQLVPDLVVPNFPAGTGMPIVQLGGTSWGETKAQLDVAAMLKEKWGLDVSAEYLFDVTQMPPPKGPGDTPPGANGGSSGAPAPSAPPNPAAPTSPAPAGLAPTPVSAGVAPNAAPAAAPAQPAAPASAFSADQAPKYASYFAPSRHGHYPGDLHEQFGLGVAQFASATGLLRRQVRRGGAPGWVWAPPAVPPPAPPAPPLAPARFALEVLGDEPEAVTEEEFLRLIASGEWIERAGGGGEAFAQCPQGLVATKITVTPKSGKPYDKTVCKKPKQSPATQPSGAGGAGAAAPTPAPATSTAVAKQQALAAVTAAQRAILAGKPLTGPKLLALPGQLQQLTVAQLKTVAAALQAGAGATKPLKADRVKALVAHAQAASQRAKAAKGPTKTQQTATARAASLTAVQAAIATIRGNGALAPADLAALPGHLSTLTVAQLDQVRKQHAAYLTGDKTKAQKVTRLTQWVTRNSGANAAVAARQQPAPPASPPLPPHLTAPAAPPPPPPAAPPAPGAAPSGGLWSRIKSAIGLGGQQGPQPGGAAQRPVTHPFAPPAVPAAQQPGAPPDPLFTGVDTNGHHWVNGKQVKAPPDETHWETGKAQPGSLNGVDFKSAPPKFWEKTADVDVGEPAPLKKIDRVSVMIQEPDGRVWIVQPTNGFGNRKFTLAGGGVEPGLTNQQNALKEVWEETGLQVEITGHLGDFEDSNNGNNGRLYIGRRVGGAPWDAKVENFIRSNRTGQPAAESEAVSLVTLEKAAQLLHRTDDLAQLMVVHPPKIDTPTSGKGSEPIKKLVAALAPKARAYDEKQRQAGVTYGPGNGELHAIQELRGYNKKPRVAAKTDMDALIAKGDHIELLRGVKDVAGVATARQLADQYRSGGHFPGHGIFGSGTYADSNKGAGNVAAQYGMGGAVMRMALPKTAKIIKASELERLVPAAPAGFVGYSGKGGKSRDECWLGVQAAIAGYDAVEVDGKSRRHGSYGKGFYVILNRSIVTVQQEDATGHVIK